jgi:hypothetical protein
VKPAAVITEVNSSNQARGAYILDHMMCDEGDKHIQRELSSLAVAAYKLHHVNQHEEKHF